MYRCESPAHGTEGLTFPPKDSILLGFNYRETSKNWRFYGSPFAFNMFILSPRFLCVTKFKICVTK